MVRHLNLHFDDADFEKLKRDKPEKQSWEDYILIKFAVKLP